MSTVKSENQVNNNYSPFVRGFIDTCVAKFGQNCVNDELIKFASATERLSGLSTEDLVKLALSKIKKPNVKSASDTLAELKTRFTKEAELAKVALGVMNELHDGSPEDKALCNALVKKASLFSAGINMAKRAAPLGNIFGRVVEGVGQIGSKLRGATNAMTGSVIRNAPSVGNRIGQFAGQASGNPYVRHGLSALAGAGALAGGKWGYDQYNDFSKNQQNLGAEQAANQFAQMLQALPSDSLMQNPQLMSSLMHYVNSPGAANNEYLKKTVQTWLQNMAAMQAFNNSVRGF